MYLLLTFFKYLLLITYFVPFSNVSIVDFEQANVYWGTSSFDQNSGDFIANLEQIQHIMKTINFVFSLITLSINLSARILKFFFLSLEQASVKIDQT